MLDDELHLESSLLVAMPQLQDPNFRRAVVLLVQHDAEGTFGLVLNRPAELSASDLCVSLDVRWRGDPNASIHWGGPVQPNTGWVLFDREDPPPSDFEEIKTVASGVCFAGSLEVLRAVAESPPPAVQLFLGYAGWGAGQLEEELAAGAWLTAPGSADVIFDVAPGGMWSHVLQSLGIDPTTLVPTHGVH
ncbi:MAG: YqgE/AlgH family protein [Myxococcota bacterium]